MSGRGPPARPAAVAPGYAADARRYSSNPRSPIASVR